MKRFIVFSSLLGTVLMSSCSFLQHVQAWRPADLLKHSQGGVPGNTTKPVNAIEQKGPSMSVKDPQHEGSPAEIPYVDDVIPHIPTLGPELFYAQQFKYAILMDVPVEKMLNHDFIDFMDYWYGTPYRLGGADSSGIDCSSFARTYIKHFYKQDLPRSSSEQYEASSRIEKDQLSEGDLVFFFTTRRKRVSHVGVYIGNNKFAHASTSSGVIISDLNEPYYLQRYAGAGRLH